MQKFGGDPRSLDELGVRLVSHARLRIPFTGSAAILCTGGLDVVRKEAWSLYRASSGVRLCWELEEPKGPKALWRFEEPGLDAA